MSEDENWLCESPNKIACADLTFVLCRSDEPPQSQHEPLMRAASLFDREFAADTAPAQPAEAPPTTNNTHNANVAVVVAAATTNGDDNGDDDDEVQIEPLLTPSAQLSGTLDASAGVLHDVFGVLSLEQCRDIVELSGDVTTAATFAQELSQLVNVPVAQLNESQQRLLVARRADLAIWRALKAVPTRTCMV